MVFEYVLSVLPKIKTSQDLMSAILESTEKEHIANFDLNAESNAIKLMAKISPELTIATFSYANAIFNSKGGKFHPFLSKLQSTKRQVAEALSENITINIPPKTTNRFRVVTVLPYSPHNLNNNILRVTLSYVNALLQHEQVESSHFLVTNELAVIDKNAILPRSFEFEKIWKTHRDILNELGCAHSVLRYGMPPMVGEGVFQSNIDILKDLKPNIIFIMNMEQTVCFSHIYRQVCPVVYLQTSLNNRPVYDYDRYLYLGEHREIDSSHIHPALWHYHPFGYPKFGFLNTISRSELKLDDNDFVMITAGNRLESEITQDYGIQMANLLIENPRIKWILLGVKDESVIVNCFKGKYDEIKDNLRFVSYSNSIGDYMNISDIYANLPRSGGAVSMSIAIYASIPVLNFDNSDANTFVPSQDQYQNLESYFSALKTISSDKNAYKTMVNRQLQQFDNFNTPEKSADDLIKHFEAVSPKSSPIS